jgi:hypothetical protein
MLQLTETLQDIVKNIKIDSYRFCISHSHLHPKETPTTVVAQLQRLPQEIKFNYLNSQLLELLYKIYFEGYVFETTQKVKTNEQILQEIASAEIDWEFYEKLDRNNQGKGWFHPSFHIIAEEADGSLVAEFDQMFLQIQREPHLPLALRSATVNDAVAIFLPSSYIHKYRYHANSDGMSDLPPPKKFRYTILIYFNFSPEAAVYAMNCVTTKLNESKVPFYFDVLFNPLNYRFYNSGILKVFSYEYNPDLYKDSILPVLQTIYTENKSQFRPEIPIFTKRLAPGIGLAERPNLQIQFRNLIDSEASYCEFVADALLEAHKNGDESPETRMEYILKHFQKFGIDIERTYLNPNAEDIYTPLDSANLAVA